MPRCCRMLASSHDAASRGALQPARRPGVPRCESECTATLLALQNSSGALKVEQLYRSAKGLSSYSYHGAACRRVAGATWNAVTV
jgi:hypothetical protein